MFETLRRWAASRHQRASEWQRLAIFWQLRGRWSLFTFSLLRREFAARAWLRQATDSTLALSQLLRATAAMFLLALFLVFALALADRILLSISPPNDPVGLLPGFIVRKWPTLTTLSLEASSIVNLLGTFVQIAGIFLGLYFAAVSMVISAYVSNGAPESVRSRLVDDLGQSGYINLIALFGAIATLLLAGVSIGIKPGIVSLG